MIDFHNHVIPNLDDGSKSLDMTIKMLKEAKRQGITDIVNTVHYQHPKMESKNTSYHFIRTELDKLKLELTKHEIDIKIHLGSEVFFKFNLMDIIDNPITTIGNSKYMLIEFQTLSFPNGYEDEFFKLQLKGITPIVAHPERYRPIQKNINIAKEWIQRGIIIQIDCGSFLGRFGKEAQVCSLNLFKNGLCHLVGSDAHNDKSRNLMLKETYEKLKLNIGIDAINVLKTNPKCILMGEKCSSYYVEKEKKIFTKIFSKFRRRE